jgi:hypothetical protein
MDYLDWNDKIAARFFTSEMKERRVYLYVTNEIIRDVGKADKAGLTDFVSVIKRGPDWVSNGNVCERALQSLAGWRRRKLGYPPYIAYLAFFVLAAGAGRGREFAAQAYYPRLRKLLGEDPVAGTYRGFGEMRRLWDDLEHWTQRDRGGELGIFEAHVSNRLIHVGIPISQTILSEQERLALPAIFVEGALDPASAPSEILLAELLFRFGRSSLRSSTLRILEGRSRHEEEFEALIDIGLQQLAGWDGTVVRTAEDRPYSAVSGTARLWCEEPDEVSGTVSMGLLCRTRHDFPEDGLMLKFAGHPERYLCEEFREGWSTPLHSEDGIAFDSALLDWCSGVRLKEINRGWRFSLMATPVRLLVSGAAEGLAGFVEVQRLMPDIPFMVIARHDCKELIEEWGFKSCAGFMRLPIRAGLPVGWQLYYLERATNDELVRDAFPILSFPRAVQITLKGGIAASQNTYFNFALPSIFVSGSGPGAELFCNGKSLGTCSSQVFHLPDDFALDSKLQFEVKSGKQTISRRAIYVQAGIAWPQTNAVSWFDRFGLVTSDKAESRSAGASVVLSNLIGFNDWVRNNPLRGNISVDFPRETVAEPDERLPVADVPTVKVSRVANVPTTTEIRALLSNWKEEVLNGIPDTSVDAVKVRPGGRELTEGYIQYLQGSRHGGRNWLRSIKELSAASKSQDQVVRAAALALLQLAFLKSGRAQKTAELVARLPPAFGRLESFMSCLGSTGCQKDVRLEGIGIGDISTLPEDKELEEKFFGELARNADNAG